MELMNAAVSVIPVDKGAKYKGLWGGFLSWTGGIFFFMLIKVGIGENSFGIELLSYLLGKQDELWSGITVFNTILYFVFVIIILALYLEDWKTEYLFGENAPQCLWSLIIFEY